jgi:hypothetical protein
MPIYQLSPPPKVRTERNLRNSRLTPTRAVLRWTGVPDSGQMRAFHAEKKRIPKTEDWLAEQDEFEL